MTATLTQHTSFEAALIGRRSLWKALAALCFLALGGPVLAAQPADISVFQAGVPAVVGTPTNLTYIITVTNSGPGTAHAVALTDSLPPQVGFVSVDNLACVAAAGQVTCAFGNLTANSSITITIVAATSCSSIGQVTNEVQVTTTDNDPTLLDNVAQTINTVADLTKPQITCPGNIVASADLSQCSKANVTFTPTATDNCPGVTTNCTPAIGSTFAVGTTTVTCTATDASGNTNACTFTVTITDDENPNITCPSLIVQVTDPGQCSRANVVWDPPVALDNCAVVSSGCTPPSGSTFPVGSNPVMCTAMDAAGHTASCTFTVMINDAQNPSIMCPGNIVASTDASQCSRANVTWDPPATSDNCLGVSASCTPPSGSTFAKGVNPVNCTAMDAAGNTASCSFTVTINDTENPTIGCPPAITGNTDAGQCSKANVTWSLTASDNCPAFSAICTPASGSTFPTGVTTVNCTNTDSSGNTASCSFTVTISDDQNPTITCPAGIVQVANPGQCSRANVVWDPPAISDNCTGASSSCTPPSGSTFNVGTNTVNCTVTDASARTATCSFTVIISDTEAPVLACANITQGTDAGQCSAVVSWAAATDNCPGVSSSCTPASGSTFPKGPTTVNCSAMDAAGNSASCSFTVTVNDTENPHITCPANIITSTDPSSCNRANVTWSAPAASDNCPGVTVSCTPPSGSTFPGGITTVTCTAIDTGGRTGTCSFTVTVEDTQDPVIVCSTDRVVECNGPNGRTVTFATSATDNCSAPANIFILCSPNSGSVFPNGVTTVFCAAFDEAGNASICHFTVNVRDTNAPAFTSCPANIVTTNALGQCSAVVSFTPLASDLCDPNPAIVCTPASGSTFAKGTTPVMCTVTDSSGNVGAPCNFTVTVNDVEKPGITCPANITGVADATFCSKSNVTWAVSASDNCTAVTSNCVPASGSTFNVGVTTVTCTATDGSGNTNACTFTVTIADTQPPTITCPANITTNSPADCVSLVVYAAPTAADNCPGVTTNCVPAPGSIFPQGVSTVTCIATDASGNTNACTFTVMVNVAAPAITTQPANQVIPMRNGAAIRVAATGTATLGYQWQSNGVNLVNGGSLGGATSATLTMSNLNLAANGNFQVIISNCVGMATSTVATLTVTPIAGISFDFNTPGQFTNAPYNLVGNDWVQGGSGTSLALNQQPFGPVVPFEVSTGGVGVATGGGGIDLAFNQTTDNTFHFLPLSFDSSLPGQVLQASIMVKVKIPITANVRAVQMGFMTATNGDSTIAANPTQLAGINGTAGLAFMSAILQDPVSGQSVINPSFGLRAQAKAASGTGATELIPVNNPTNALATNNWYKFTAKFVNTSATNANQLTIESTLQDMGISGTAAGAIVLSMPPQAFTIPDLVTSNRWYFGVRTSEQGGVDYLDNIYVTTQPGPLAVVVPVADAAVSQGKTAEFRALVDGDGPYTYQWFKNGTAIAGAGNWKYTTPPVLLTDNGAKFSVTVTGPASSISSTGTVTVLADPLKVLSVGSVDGGSIGLRFSRPVDKTSAETAANYTVNGTAAKAAQLLAGNGIQQYRTNGTEVLITPAAPISGAFTVVAANVTGLDGPAISSPNDTASGTVAGLINFDVDPQSIGENLQVPTLPGITYSFAPGQFTTIAGGHDIFGSYDGFHFTYQQVTGDFDFKVHIPYEDMVRVPNKAGFEARVSLDPASPNVGAFADPMPPGRNFIEGVVRPLYNVGSASFGANPRNFYPNVWLRFRRVGNTFMYYSSTNGVNWNHQGQTSPFPSFPPTIFVGLAANCNVGQLTLQQYATSQYDQYGPFAYSLAVITNLTGPSNITVSAGSAATFTNISTLSTNGVLYALAGELAFTWQRTNTAAGGWTNMPSAGATNHVLNTGNLYFTDNGAQFRAIISAPGALSITSSVATVTVTDSAAPTISSSIAAPFSPNQLVVNFSELMGSSAAVAGNYNVTNGLGVKVNVTSATFLNGDLRTVVLTVDTPLVGGTNTVGMVGVKDLNNNSVANTTLAIVQTSLARPTASGPQLLGPVVTEFYTALISRGGVQDLIDDPKYGRSALEATVPNGSPDFFQYSNIFGIHPGSFPSPGFGENYGARIYSYFRPGTTANYKFYLRADDFAELWINTNIVNSTVPIDAVVGTSTNSPILQQAWMCMDGVETNASFRSGASSKYLNFDSGTAVGQPSGFYVTPAIGSTVVGGVRFYAAGDSPERDPLTFTLAGSTAPGTNGPWVAIAADNTQIANTGGSSGTGRYMPSPNIMFTNTAGASTNTTSYRSYRVLFPFAGIRGPSQNSMQIGEVQFLNSSGAKIVPSGATMAVQLDVNNSTFNITNSSSNAVFSAGTPLTAGQLYYIEARFKETGGGDGATVAVRSDAAIPATTEVISNNLLVFPIDLAPYTPIQFEMYNGLKTLNPLNVNGVTLGGFGNTGAGSIADLLSVTNNTNFIARIPNINGYTKILGWNTNLVQSAGTFDNYLGRLYAYFVAPSNGVYKFWMASDDSSQIWMNTNAVNSTDPGGMSLIGQLNAFTGSYTLVGQNVSLTGGQRYYLEARWREGTGGDGIRIQIKSQGDGSTPGAGEAISASFFELATNEVRYGPIKLAGIVAQTNGVFLPRPGNTITVNEGQTVTFNAEGVSGENSAQGSEATANISTGVAIGAGENQNLLNMGLVWMKNGSNVFANQVFAGQMYYVTQPLTFADNNSTITLLVSNTYSVAMQTLTINVNQDLTPPTILSAVASQYGDTVLVTFSEPVDSLTSETLANWTIPGLQIFSASRDDVRRDRVSLRTSRQAATTVYTVTATGIRDVSQAGNVMATGSKSFTSWGFGGLGAGSVLVEIFTNLNGSLDEFLQTSPKYIYDMPDFSYYTNDFGVSIFNTDSGGNVYDGSGGNFYAARVVGAFCPPTNGLYQFYCRGDDGTRIYMNTNGPDPAGRVLIARNDGANSGAITEVSGNVLQGYQTGQGLGRVGNSVSPILSLTNGTCYYMEALLKEGTGGDYLEVVMRAVDPATLTPIGGVPVAAAGNDISAANGQLLYFTTAGNPDLLGVAQRPIAETNVLENTDVNLTVGIKPVGAPASIQWQRYDPGSASYVTIPGVNGLTLTRTMVLADNGTGPGGSDATFRVNVTMPGVNGTFISVVHVLPDLVPPQLVSAGSSDGATIDLVYSERVNFGGGHAAGDPFYHTVNGGAVNVIGVVPVADANGVTNRSVLFLDQTISGNFEVQVLGFDDLSKSTGDPDYGNFNNGDVTGRVLGVTPLDIGNAAGGALNIAGAYNYAAVPPYPLNPFSPTNGALDVVANGYDIWNGVDGFHFDYPRQVSGNFDLKVRIQKLVGADQWSKAGLMARGSTNANSRFINIIATPTSSPILNQASNNFFSFQWRDFDGASAAPNLGNTDGSQTNPPAYPNAWVRLTRVGNVFSGYSSSDGVNWVPNGSRDTSLNSGGAFPNTIYVGLCSVSHDQTRTLANNAKVEYRDINFPTPPTITVQPSPALQVVPIHSTVTYSVTAVNPPGSGVLTYQWLKNGSVIPGATSSSLTLANVAVTDSGTYQVNAANDGGGTPSAGAVLIVSNALPVVGNESLSLTQGQTLTVTTGSLLSNDSDPEGDPLSLLWVSGVAPVSFSADFNSGSVPAGTAIYGNAAVQPTGGTGNSGHLELQPAANNAAGSIVIGELTPNKRVSAFSASFNLKIYQGSAEPADGFSFNFGPDLPDGAGTAAAAEQGGTAVGFSFCVDNYRFQPINVGGAYNNPGGGTANTSGLKINYGGILIKGVQIHANLAGALSAWNEDRYVPVSINVLEDGTCTVLVDGTNVFGTFVLPGYTPSKGRFGCYSRSGGQNQAVELDDLSMNVRTIDTALASVFNAGGNLYGSAAVVSSALHLNEAAGGQAGSLVLNQLAPGVPVNSFTATFTLQVGNGSAEPADGFSFNFGNDLPDAATTAAAAEQGGTATGFSFCLDNYQFAPLAVGAAYNAPGGGTANTSGLKINYNGVIIAGVQIPTWASSTPQPVSISVDSGGNLTVLVSGTNVFGALTLPGWTPTVGRFGLYSRTGGAYETHWVDNLGISVNGGATSYTNAFDQVFGSGTVTMSGGNVTYTPPPNGCGFDSYYYGVSDGQLGGLTLGQVNVQVYPTNNTPPTISTCPTNRTLAVDMNCQVALPNLLPELVVNDACCCSTISQSPPAGTILSQGQSVVVTLTVTNSVGLTASCQATITAATVVDPTVQLSIVRSGSNLVISWPKTCATYNLEKSSNLASWLPAGVTANLVGSHYEATVLNTGTFFYRLKHN